MATMRPHTERKGECMELTYIPKHSMESPYPLPKLSEEGRESMLFFHQ